MWLYMDQFSKLSEGITNHNDPWFRRTHASLHYHVQGFMRVSRYIRLFGQAEVGYKQYRYLLAQYPGNVDGVYFSDTYRQEHGCTRSFECVWKVVHSPFERCTPDLARVNRK
ncbi:uncharacterized protein AKAW2_60050A [Aspergillus luchuensis]|uniref:Uncharacterized protein n=1 Tax=Aspergillus kawachii TaxID=1069201 RepID=A0A7R7WEZ7_ASPKA|nr:uncharacterized protein AKAW2_60050A [Aspergillus luchuensis]BCS01786.1 hypothetical protein AKAW2_60050A [Aspergillus luchuensis]